MPVTRVLQPLLMLAALASVVLAAGCGTGRHSHQPDNPRPARLFTERESSNGSTIHVAVGDKIVLILGSSYWTFAGSSAPVVVRQTGPVTLMRTTRTCVPEIGRAHV